MLLLEMQVTLTAEELKGNQKDKKSINRKCHNGKNQKLNKTVTTNTLTGAVNRSNSNDMLKLGRRILFVLFQL
jgi:hypothetical protein